MLRDAELVHHPEPARIEPVAMLDSQIPCNNTNRQIIALWPFWVRCAAVDRGSKESRH